MPISNINRVKTLTVSLTVSSSDDIVTVYENSGLTVGDELISGYTIVSLNSFMKNLRAFATIKSLPEVPLPNFKLDDSETDKLYKTLDIEWKSPRKQLDVYISSSQITYPSGEGWHQIGSVSLLNPYGYPYRVYNLMDLFTDNLALELGDNSKVGIRVVEVGYGLLDADDKVTIHGSYVEEFFVMFEDKQIVINTTGAANNQPSDNFMGNSSTVNNNFLVGN